MSLLFFISTKFICSIRLSLVGILSTLHLSFNTIIYFLRHVWYLNTLSHNFMLSLVHLIVLKVSKLSILEIGVVKCLAHKRLINFFFIFRIQLISIMRKWQWCRLVFIVLNYSLWALIAKIDLLVCGLIWDEIWRMILTIVISIGLVRTITSSNGRKCVVEDYFLFLLASIT